MQPIPLRHMWPEDMVFVIISTPHIYSAICQRTREEVTTPVCEKNVQILTRENLRAPRL